MLPGQEPAHDARRELFDDVLAGRVSRRSLFRRAAVLGLSAPVVATLLAACGGDDDDDAPATTDTSGASTAAATESAAGSETTPAASGDATPAGTSTGEGTAAATTAPALEGKPGGTLTYAILRDATSLDPHIDTGATSATIQANIYDTLITYDPDGNVIPSLAESWENPDETTFIFHLRQDVTFHDGSPFTADDVIASIDRILDEATSATRGPEFANLSSYTAIDEYTVELKTAEVWAPVLAVLASLEANMISAGWEGDYAVEANGTGPFMLDSFEANVRYTIVKNPNYWQPGLPYLDKIDQLPITDDNARINAFKSGQVEFCTYIPWQNIMEFESDPNYSLEKGTEIFQVVRFNVGVPPFDNKLVRQALNYAMDRQAMVDLAFGGQGEVNTVALIPNESVWYNQELDGHWTYDPDKARALLAEAGINDPSEISVTIRSSSSTVHFDTAQIVTQQLQTFGVNVTLEPQDSATLLERRQSGDYQMMMDGRSMDLPDPDFYSAYFETGGPLHAGAVGYSNPELDALLEQGRTLLDFEERKEIYRQAEEIILDDAPFLFLYWRVQAEAAIAELKGYQRFRGVSGFSEAFLENLWFDR